MTESVWERLCVEIGGRRAAVEVPLLYDGYLRRGRSNGGKCTLQERRQDLLDVSTAATTSNAPLLLLS